MNVCRSLFQTDKKNRVAEFLFLFFNNFNFEFLFYSIHLQKHIEIKDF